MLQLCIAFVRISVLFLALKHRHRCDWILDMLMQLYNLIKILKGLEKMKSWLKYYWYRILYTKKCLSIVRISSFPLYIIIYSHTSRNMGISRAGSAAGAPTLSSPCFILSVKHLISLTCNISEAESCLFTSAWWELTLQRQSRRLDAVYSLGAGDGAVSLFRQPHDW